MSRDIDEIVDVLKRTGPDAEAVSLIIEAVIAIRAELRETDRFANETTGRHDIRLTKLERRLDTVEAWKTDTRLEKALGRELRDSYRELVVACSMFFAQGPVFCEAAAEPARDIIGKHVEDWAAGKLPEGWNTP